MKIQHFVLTRFNLRLKSFDKFCEWRGGDPGYLEKRFELFERYCLPSMKAQTVDFKWLVFFSEMTPEPFKARARAYAGECNSYEAVFVGDSIPCDTDGAATCMMNEIVKRLATDTDYYVVSRIDNDDAFNMYALGWIRDTALEKIVNDSCEKFYVVMPYGNAYIAEQSFTQDYKWDWNHFPTLVCRKGILDNPFWRSHDSIRKTGVPVVRVPNRHAWLEVVNGTNAKNDLRTYCSPKFLSSRKLHDLFAIEVKMSRFRFAFFWLFIFLPHAIVDALFNNKKRNWKPRR